MDKRIIAPFRLFGLLGLLLPLLLSAQQQGDSSNAYFTLQRSGAGIGGLSVGQSEQTRYEMIRNPDVLEALIKLTGKNFEYDDTAWKAWFAQQKKPETLDGRRG